MKFRSQFVLATLLVTPWLACSNSAGGGGGFAPQKSSAGADSPCNPTTHASGCLATGQQVMACDAASSKWQAGAVCPTGSYCVEQFKTGATVFTAECVQTGTAAKDAGSTGDSTTGTLDTGASSDGSSTNNDAGTAVDGQTTDTGSATTDTGITDSGTTDTGTTDTGTTDTGFGTPDTGGTTDTGSGDTLSSGDVLPSDPLVEPNVAQPPVGSTVLAPQVTCPSDGTKVTNDKNGVKVVYHTKKTASGDVFHGSFEMANSQGAILTKSCYIDGKHASTTTGWWANGTKRVSIHYTKDGFAQGPYETWDENGNTVAKGVLKSDEFYGEYVKWYDGGKQMERKLYFNPPGQLRGTQKFWHENGTDAARSFFDAQGKQNGTSRSWDDTGKLLYQGNYVDTFRHGVHSWWSSTGFMFGQIKFDKGTGTMLFKHANGKVSDTGKRVNGKREGLWESFAEDGTKTFEGTFTANAGPVKYWFASGKKGIVSSYDGEERYHGSYAEWASDGVQTWAGKMSHGSRVGTWKYAPQAGQIVDLCYVKGTLAFYDACPSTLITE